MLTVTPAAAEQIRIAARNSDCVGMALRVAARQVSDGSIEYGMGFDEACSGDEVRDCEGVTVVVAAISRPLLHDTVLDWVELEPGDFRFIFVPPQGAPGEQPPGAEPACGGAGSADHSARG
jgi:iron-sulfur cluster assembly protein